MTRELKTKPNLLLQFPFLSYIGYLTSFSMELDHISGTFVAYSLESSFAFSDPPAARDETVGQALLAKGIQYQCHFLPIRGSLFYSLGSFSFPG